MALLRIVHAGQMPDPSDLARIITGGQASAAATPSPAQSPDATGAPQAAMPADFRALVAALDDRFPRLAGELNDCVGLIHYAPGELVIRLLQPLASDFARQLADALLAVTGTRWSIGLSDGDGQPSLRQQDDDARAADVAAITQTPVIKAALEAFPDAALVEGSDDQPWSESA